MFLMLFFLSTICKAEESVKDTKSIGQLANELNPPVSFLNDFIVGGSFILGVVCFFWAFHKFLEYKENPYTTTLGSVILIVITAVALVFLPLFPIIIGADVNPLQK